MNWLAVVIVLWASSGAHAPPVVKIPVASEALCREALDTLRREIGGDAASAALNQRVSPGDVLLAACIRVRDE